MRRVLYSVAMSLDGFIAGPNGEYDWIPHDPAVDWGAFMGRFDTMLLGRKTFAAASGGGPSHSMHTYVFSRTLTLPKKSKAILVRDDAAGVVAKLRAEPDNGKEIWLMGGGELFRSLLDAGQVDAIELGVVPVLLGKGVPFLAPGGTRKNLTLTESRPMPSGMMRVSYAVR